MNGTQKSAVRSTREQLDAANPARSVWVMANAGSGKTHVLVNRVVRLMLAGFAPQSILCLTFTKAAAAEMSLRLFNLLASWIALDDEELAARLSGLGVARVKPDDLARARRLFAIAIETPGGLKIQTIHAFCEKLLQLFPAESGLAPGFRVMDETESRQLLEEARDAALAAAAEANDLSLIDDGTLSADGFESLSKAFLAATSPFADAISGTADLAAIEARLRRVAGTLPYASTAEIDDAVLARDRSRYRQAAEALAGTPSFHGKDASAIFRQFADAHSAEELVNLLTGELFTDKGEPGKRGLFSTATRARHSDICNWFDAESATLVQLLTQRALSVKIDATLALLRLMIRVNSTFQTLKQERGLYDFDDLIMRTQALLQDSRAAQWVLYKLDGRLSHILVDEAQDTSPTQWGIITALADEFFAGEGAERPGPRSLFVVGDIKQSIYSFQGADTDAFAAARDHFRGRLAGVNTPLAEIDLTLSYRSLPAVLHMVDAVFAEGAPAHRGLRDDARDGGHQPNRKDEGDGIFELWPLFTPPDRPEPDPWHAPVDRAGEDSPRLLQARDIAGRIKGWIGQRLLPSKNRPVEPGDILILLQKRGSLFDALIAELRRLDVPVAGADRLKLQESLAVMDLMALVQVCLLPGDDLSLACVLKSPLVPEPLDDDDLTRLAAGRTGDLWSSLEASGTQAANVAFLAACRASAVLAGPHGFLAQVLTQARRAIAARLGVEALDATAMLLDAALDFERDQGTSLAAFLHWFMARDEDMKRELEGASGEVRIMTVHGAKGLEGNIVILPDAADMPGSRGGPSLLALPGGGNGPALLPLFDAATVVKPDSIRDWKDVATEKNKDERKRLLYVAMTRARDELYIGGTQGVRSLDDDCWYRLVEDGLAKAQEKHSLRVITGEHPAGDIRRWGDEPEEMASSRESPPEAPLPTMPGWATRDAPIGSSEPGWSTVTRVAARTSAVFDREAARTGQALHRVLEHLQAGDSIDTVQHRLARQKLDPALAGPLHAVLQRPDTQGYFAADARSEAAIAGALDGLPPVQGRIDRLRIDAAEIWLLDFKTGKPGSAAAESHIRQMALYSAVLAAAFPGRKVRAALLWTHGMQLENLAESRLSRILEGLRQEHQGETA